MLDSTQNFMIPEFLETIQTKFEELDLILSFFKTKITPPFISNLQSSLLNTKESELSMDDIMLILRLYPSCYNLEWDKNKGKMELKLSFPVDENSNVCYSKGIPPRKELNNRKEQMKRHIFDIIKSIHDSFLLSLNPPVQYYDYNNQSFWHHLFDINTITIDDLPPLDNSIIPLQDSNTCNSQFDIGKELITSNKYSLSKASVFTKNLSIISPLKEDVNNGFGSKEILQKLMDHYRKREVSNMF